MKKILIYTTSVCPYCARAKALFDRKGFKYEEMNAEDLDVRNEMIKKSGGARSVPQIFIDNQHIGGCDDLYALDREGKLDNIMK